VACLGHLAWALWLLGYPQQAWQRSQEAITRAQELAHPFSLTQAQAAVTIATAQGFAQQQAQGFLLHGWALAKQGHRSEGIAQMRKGLEGWEATGARLLRPYYLALLAETYGQGGQSDEAQRLLSEALVTARQTGERNHEAEVHRLQGELLLTCHAEQPIAAEAAFRQALEVARGQQARSLELRAAVRLGRLWEREGRRTEARRLLVEVYTSFGDGLETLDLQGARVLLQELADRA
jgi:predicted ATPase